MEVFGGNACQPAKSYYCGPKFTVLWGRVEEVLLLNKFFSDFRYMP